MKLGKYEDMDFVFFIIALLLNFAIIGVDFGTLIGTILGSIISVLFLKPLIKRQ